MKPDWSWAPSWAKYVAQDDGGLWHWFEFKPSHKLVTWSSTTGRMARVRNPSPWNETLQSKP